MWWLRYGFGLVDVDAYILKWSVDSVDRIQGETDGNDMKQMDPSRNWTRGTLL